MNKQKKNNSFIFVLGLVLALVLLNVLSLKAFVRIDLTKDGKYTLSQASIETMQALKDTITVSAYFSEGLPPPYAQNARYVADLLEEYRAKSNGHFAFQFIDPMKLESEEDKVMKKDMRRDIFGRIVREPTSIEKELGELGLQPVEIRVIEDDQQQSKRAYMGIVIRYQDKHEVIPLVQNLADVEKDLTAFMRKLVREKMPSVGVIRDFSAPSIARILAAMGKDMKVSELSLDGTSEISDDIDALFVVGSGEHFGDNGAQKIDRFLRKGKSAAFFLERVSVDPQSFEAKAVPADGKAQKIFALLKSYGIDIDDSLVADASCASLNMQENRNGFNFSIPIKYPFVPELMNLSFDSLVTKGLSGVILPFTAQLIVDEKAMLKTDVLARSSKVSWNEKAPFDLNPRRNWGKAEIVPNGPFTLMVQARGNLSGPNAENDKGDKSPESRLIVVGSSAFLWDDFLNESNKTLALNIADWMIADGALLAMRAREFNDTPLNADLPDSLRQAAKYGNILGVPFLLILYGFIRWRLREARRNKLRLG
jgi:ABC-type uncharacterized transport system involved in gliding motility auxiliary subunit